MTPDAAAEVLFLVRACAVGVTLLIGIQVGKWMSP